MRSKCLITGAAGFVGSHLIEYLNSEETELLAIDRCAPCDVFPCRLEQIDLAHRHRFETLISEFRPDRLIHLAAASSVAESWRNPAGCISNNVGILLNLLESVRHRAPRCRILMIGSSEVYDDSNEPLAETDPLRATNPYAVGRIAQENLVRIYVECYNLDIVQTRSFSHTGPGQTPRFAVPSFVQQLCETGRRGETVARLRTGNVDLIRDFTDIRDVVRAYDLLLRRGRTGETYNVCSGKGVSLRQIIETAARLMNTEAVIEIDPTLIRPSDARYMVGNAAKLRCETGWSPRFSLEQTLGEMIREINIRAGVGKLEN